MSIKDARIFFLLPLLFSCSPSREKADIPAFEEKWSCFNGCYIVRQEGKYGLVNEEGSILLPLSYTSVEFLDNDILLACTENTCHLIERSGRNLFRGESPDSLRAHYGEIVEQIHETDRLSWEKVVENYSKLCRESKSRRGKRLSRTDFASLQMLSEAVHQSLEAASGKPTPSQKARLEQLSIDYRRAF